MTPDDDKLAATLAAYRLLPEPTGGDDAPANLAPASKPARRPRTPKAAPLSKEAQLRALREHGRAVKLTDPLVVASRLSAR